jgi:hypothetical protein
MFQRKSLASVSREFRKKGQLFQSFTRFSYRPKRAEKDLWLLCDNPLEIFRVDAGLRTPSVPSADLEFRVWRREWGSCPNLEILGIAFTTDG